MAVSKIFFLKAGLNEIESVIILHFKPLSESLLGTDLDQKGSPAWSAAGRTGGVQKGQGCPCVGRHTQVHGGGVFVQQPSLGGYLREKDSGEEFTSTRLIADI